MADLIDRDLTIYELEAFKESCITNLLRMSFDDITDVVKGIPAVNRWISVEDALPKEGTRVIAVVDGESREAIFSYNAFHGSNFYRDKCDIEWWMPMPDAYEPPEKE